MKSSEIRKLREFINKNFGEKFISKKEVVYKEKSKFVQQGHEAVTPTNFDEPDTLLATLIALRPELICIVI